MKYIGSKAKFADEIVAILQNTYPTTVSNNTSSRSRAVLT